MASLSSVLRSTAFAVVATLSCASAFATVVQSPSQTAFLAGLQPGAYTENFNNTQGQQFAASFSFSNANFGYVVTPGIPQGANDDVYLSGTFLGNTYSTIALIVTFNGSPTAVGGNFFLTDPSDAFASGPVNLQVVDVNGARTSFNLNPSSAASYFGYTSTIGIASLIFGGPAASQFNSIDNFTVGRAALTAAIPEPATVALLAGGLMTLALARRRRQS